MSDFVICDGSPISVQRIIDKKFDEDVDVCEKTAYIEKKAAEEKFQKELEKIKDEYLKKCKEAEDEYKKECKVIGERYKKIIQQLYETATGKKNEENLEKDEQNFSMTIRQCLFRRWAEVNEIEIPADLNNKIKIKDVLDEIGEDREENDIIKEFRRNLYSNIDTIMGDIEIDGKRIRAHEALTAGKKKSKLTIDNYVFFKSVLLDGDIEAGNNIIEIIDENRSLELDDREKDIIRYGLYSLAQNPNMLITDKMVKERAFSALFYICLCFCFSIKDICVLCARTGAFAPYLCAKMLLFSSLQNRYTTATAINRTHRRKPRCCAIQERESSLWHEFTTSAQAPACCPRRCSSRHRQSCSSMATAVRA